jgi:hypothetical protein
MSLTRNHLDAKLKLHRDGVAADGEAEKIAAAVGPREGVKFQRARKTVRNALTADGVSGKIDALVAKPLDGLTVPQRAASGRDFFSGRGRRKILPSNFFTEKINPCYNCSIRQIELRLDELPSRETGEKREFETFCAHNLEHDGRNPRRE